LRCPKYGDHTASTKTFRGQRARLNGGGVQITENRVEAVLAGIRKPWQPWGEVSDIASLIKREHFNKKAPYPMKIEQGKGSPLGKRLCGRKIRVERAGRKPRGSHRGGSSTKKQETKRFNSVRWNY